MQFLDKIIIWMATMATSVISSAGYFGVFMLMAVDSTMIPLPSELVMPFAGYLAFEGRFDFLLVVFVSALGTIVGSLFSYYVGKYGGEPILEKYGRYVLINKKDLDWTHKWFQKHGESTIFISRFIPVVRQFISIPAGMSSMNLPRFILYTFLGGFIWNGILAYTGYALGQRWDLAHKYFEPLKYAAVLLIIAGVTYFIYKHLRHPKRK